MRRDWKTKRRFDYVLLWWNAFVLVVFVVLHLDLVLFLHGPREEDCLPTNAIASAAFAKEICGREITSDEYEERRTKLLRDSNMK